MESNELISIEILEQLSKLEKKVGSITYLSYTDVGKLLNKKPSVIAQYAKAGLIHPIQQGPKKIITYEDICMLKVYFHLTEYYGCSYVACKLFGSLLKRTECLPQNYLTFVKELEKEQIPEKELEKHVNSYKNRGIFQKKKNQQ